MAPHITCQTIRLPVTRSGMVEDGFLIFADGILVAVFTRLETSINDDLLDLRGLWDLETGYGPCVEAPGTDHTFRTPDEAQRWVLERVTYPRENRGP